MDTLFKQFQADVKAESGSRAVKFRISTNAVDRDGDRIDPKGWDFSNYKKSPVVLWSHDYSQPPIAKATHLAVTEDGLSATAEFPPKGVHPFADTVFELLKGGFLTASSVGFKPIEYEQASDRGKGYNYMKQELLEFSVVPVPANPEALIQMSAEHADSVRKSVAGWCESFLGAYYGERGVWLPASQVEKTFEAINKSGLLLDGKVLKRSSAERVPDAVVIKADTAVEGAVTKPLPTPSGDEDESAFIGRCMADPHMNEKFPEQDQRAGVCYSQWRGTKAAVSLDDEPVLVVEDDYVPYDAAAVERQLRDSMRAELDSALAGLVAASVRRAVDYARGRVS